MGSEEAGTPTVAVESLNEDGRAVLTELREDFAEVTGAPFTAFFCPILFRDEDVPLCRAHVVNKAIRGAPRNWTIQRKDVDNYYGSLMEAEFTLLQERGKHDLFDLLADPELRRRLDPKITVDGQEVGHFTPSANVPDAFSVVELQDGVKKHRLALKLEPNDLLDLIDREWEVAVNKDLRLWALGSLLKAAHLTLFSLLGYNYALSGGGHFLGWTVLGSFFAEHAQEERAPQVVAAYEHFPEFVGMVRPVLAAPSGVAATLEGGQFYACGAGKPWGLMVFVQMAEDMAAVIVPVFENVEASVYFLDFLRKPPAKIPVRLGQYANGQFEIARQVQFLAWPEPKFHGPFEG